MNSTVYFPGLNSLRFFAAFLVYFSHVEQLKGLFGFENYYALPAIRQVGNLSVSFFFVLSGFLITYLLFAEREKTQSISVKDFYIRRLLRIWPLYYLIVILGLFILPNFSFLYTDSLRETLTEGLTSKIILYSLFLPQVVLITLSRSVYLEPTWSIGIEEQFYLFWPVLVKYFKNFVKLMVVLLLILLSIRLTAIVLSQFSTNALILKVANFTKNYFYFARFQCMIAGGIAAYLLFQRQKQILNFIFSKTVQLIAYATLFVCLIAGVSIFRINHELYSLLFMILILNVAGNPRSIIQFNNKPLDYLGNISYGLYMFHELAIGISISLIGVFLGYNFTDAGSFAALYIVSFIFTVLISMASYHFFEARFLKYKSRFSTIVTKDKSKWEKPVKLGSFSYLLNMWKNMTLPK
jgi:peptidoglycan/LPS O-acetylase OafA/YrhL